MRACIIDGAVDESDVLSAIVRTTASVLLENNWQIDTIPVRQKDIGYCIACGACGDKTPGVCALKDEGSLIVEKTAECDLMIFVSSISFGSYASSAKKFIERTMPNIHPLFLKHRGELHHRYRYRHSPSLLVFGWQAEPDENEARIYRKIAERNAVNFLSPKHGSFIFTGNPRDLELKIAAIIAEMNKPDWKTTEMLPFPEPDLQPFGDSSTPGLILCASNRRNSNSKSIMHYIEKGIVSYGLQCQTFDIAANRLLDGQEDSLVEAARSAGRIILIAPLYHDTLSYAATKALEVMAARCAELPDSISFSAIVHSGYPEPAHTRTALHVCRHFAQKMEWRWQGGLTAGASSTIGGQPLEKAGGMSKHLRQGLDLAIEALIHGKPMPMQAVNAAAKCFIPPILFRLAANHMVRSKFKKAGRDIDARPYEGK